MRRYFGLVREHHAMSATKTIATANAAARPTAEERVMVGIVRRRRAASSLAHLARGARQPLPHPLRLPQVPVLVPRQNREAGEEIVPHMRVERRSHAHLGKRQAVGLGETVELRGLETIEFL